MIIYTHALRTLFFDSVRLTTHMEGQFVLAFAGFTSYLIFVSKMTVDYESVFFNQAKYFN